MCGRYVVEDFQELSEVLRQIPFQADYRPDPTWNAAPTQILPVIVEDDGAWHLRPMQWGLIPRWTKPGEKPKVAPINARAETLAEKPMFRGLMKNRRCLVPANGFYEWKRLGSAKQPYFIHLRDEPLMLFAGLYDEARDAAGDPFQTYTIITGGPNAFMADIHDRMPMIIEPDDAPLWMDPDEQDPAPLEHLLQPIAAETMDAYPVSRAVNNTRNNSPDLIEPLDDDNDEDA
ncbi:MAG TPA: SOS response-associated peptidase [Thermomicrobiales bacterium]|nr:SOS response-associated peptidase [Thermomicrobiales bacterium]